MAEPDSTERGHVFESAFGLDVENIRKLQILLSVFQHDLEATLLQLHALLVTPKEDIHDRISRFHLENESYLALKRAFMAIFNFERTNFAGEEERLLAYRCDVMRGTISILLSLLQNKIVTLQQACITVTKVIGLVRENSAIFFNVYQCLNTTLAEVVGIRELFQDCLPEHPSP